MLLLLARGMKFSYKKLSTGHIRPIIKIDVKSGRKSEVGGITEGEKQFYYLHEVVLNVGDWNFPTKVGFMPKLSKLGYGLVGQKGFFDLFRSVNFDFNKGDIELKTK